MANEMSISGKSEAEINAFLDKILGAMRATVKTGLAAPTSTLPGPIKLKTKARRRLSRTRRSRTRPGAQGDRPGLGLCAGRLGRECARPPRDHRADRRLGRRDAGGRLFARRRTARSCPNEKIREGLLAAAVVGYLCKHNATLSAAEGGCQAEIGVASAMGAAVIAQAYDEPPQVVANAAEGALEHHLGMTCDPVAGFVQIPCIERCAFGAVKAWTGYLIAKQRDPGEPPRRFRQHGRTPWR